MRSSVLAGGVFLLMAAAVQAAAPPFPGIVTKTIASTDGVLPIPDAAALTLILPVADLPGTIVDVDVAVDILHPAPTQLRISLISPSGTAITLTSNNGGNSRDVFAGTTFDDQATGTPSAPNVRNFTYAAAVATGPIQPEEALGALVGEPAEGPWILVVLDDTAGQTGTLRGWSLVVSVLPPGALHAAAPVAFPGAGLAIPDNKPAGVTSSVTVSGMSARLYHASVAVDITHPNAADLDLFLTGPGGQRIDLVTAVGAGKANLYGAGTVFDDQAGTPIGDLTLPASGTAIGHVVGEGALGAFLGLDPNGTWTLKAVDHAAGNVGTLNGWTLTLTGTGVCGDGVVDPGEQCDDGNLVSGDGCDANCTATACGNGIVTAGEDCDDGNTADGDACPASCKFPETKCDDCVDNDGNGLTDAADPACHAASLTLRRGILVPATKGKLLLVAGVSLAGAPSGAASLALSGATGPVLCGTLGPLRAAHGRAFAAKGRLGGGTVTLTLVKGRLTLRGSGLDLHGLDATRVTLGMTLGDRTFAGGAAFHVRGRNRLFP